MAGITGYTPTPAAFDPQVHMDAIYAHFDSKISPSVATAAALPSTGNWPGRTFLVVADGTIRTWIAGAWVIVREDTGWITLPLSNSWVTYGAPYEAPRYRRLNGVVFIDSMLKLGTFTSGTVIATLPAGFRPAKQHMRPVVANNAFGSVEVNASGTITVNVLPGNASLSLELSFIAEA